MLLRYGAKDKKFDRMNQSMPSNITLKKPRDAPLMGKALPWRRRRRSFAFRRFVSLCAGLRDCLALMGWS
jgi:hypothetical protein